MREEWSQRLKRLLFNLFYPAVLGTFFFSLLPAVGASIRRGLDFSAAPDWKLILCLLVVAHFFVDYIFTEEVRTYQVRLFMVDLAVVVLLYNAYYGVNLEKPEEIDCRAIALEMTGVYACFLFWKSWNISEIGKQQWMTIYQVAFFLVFLAVWRIWPNVELLAFSLAAATLAMIVVCGRVLRQYHWRGRGSAHSPDLNPG